MVWISLQSTSAFSHTVDDLLLRQIGKQYVGTAGPVPLDPDVPDKQGQYIEQHAAGQHPHQEHLSFPVPVQKKRKPVALGNSHMRPGLFHQWPDFPEIPDAKIHFVFISHILQIPQDDVPGLTEVQEALR